MNVFVWEALSAGVGPIGASPEALRREGRAMLSAVTQDLLQVDGVRVTTILAEPLSPTPRGLRVELLERDGSELDLFRKLATDADVCWIIAPETGGLLAERIRIAEEAGARCCNCSSAATELCGDKLRLFEFLRERNIPTIETFALAHGEWPDDVVFPCVVKPRDGAGSEGCHRVDSAAGRAGSVSDRSAFESEENCVIQPFIAGIPVSTAALVYGERHIIFPVGRQLIDEISLHYRGGVVPAAVPQSTVEGVIEIVRSCLDALDGLCGYVGFDLIVPDADPSTPLLVEINPRLTTAYVGYRRLTQHNLAERVLFPERSSGDIAWDNACVRFSPDGADCVVSDRNITQAAGFCSRAFATGGGNAAETDRE